MMKRATERYGLQKLGPGKGGLAHRWFQARIRDHFEGLGHIARIEAYLPNTHKGVDVGVWKTREKVAIEVAMTPAHEVENVKKDLAAGWDRVVVACPNEGVLRKMVCEIQHNLDEGFIRGRVDFISVHDLVS